MSRNTRGSANRRPQEGNSIGGVPTAEQAAPAMPATQEPLLVTNETTEEPQNQEAPTTETATPLETPSRGSDPLENDEQEAQERELRALEKRVWFAKRKAELLQELRDRNHEAAVLEAETQSPAPVADDAVHAATPTTAAPSTEASSIHDDALTIRTIARSHLREPRAPANIKPYEGKSTDEWHAFKSANEAFWDRNPEWFDTDKSRVSRVTEFLSDKMNTDWMQYRKDNPSLEITWAVFEEWALSQVADPAKLQRDAMSNWWRHTQKHHQSVNEYANHMTSIYNTLKDRPPKKERIHRLWTGILRDIEMEARRFPEPTTDKWDDWVKFYNMVEQQMPSRVSLLKGKKQEGSNKDTAAKQERQKQPTPGSKSSNKQEQNRNGDWRSRNGNSWNRDRNPRKRKFEGTEGVNQDGCFVCKKPGHIAKYCPEAMAAKTEPKK